MNLSTDAARPILGPSISAPNTVQMPPALPATVDIFVAVVFAFALAAVVVVASEAFVVTFAVDVVVAFVAAVVFVVLADFAVVARVEGTLPSVLVGFPPPYLSSVYSFLA